MNQDMPADPTTPAEAAQLIRAGKTVAFPTETVYGLGADAFNPQAVAQIFEAKGRPTFDPLIVHVASAQAAGQVVATFPATAQRLSEAFWPGPLTLVLPKRDTVPDLVTAGLATVGVRVPAHRLAQALIQASGTAIAAPSANRFGRISPTTAEHVRQEFAGQMPVLDGGPCRGGIESTVISLADKPTVLRLGGITLEQLESALGHPVALAQATSRPAEQTQNSQPSPGMLDRHYAPRTKLILMDQLPQAPPAGRAGLLMLDAPAQGRWTAVENLGAVHDLANAAARLFGAMRRLDEAQLDLIIAVRVPETGLGRAINDRLGRASLQDSR